MWFIAILQIVPHLAVLFCFNFICLVIYRLYFHPLASFPGPKLAAATQWYEFYYDVLKGDGGQFVWELGRIHEVYGPIVRINPNEIHVKDSDWHEVLYAKNPTHRDKWPPAAQMAGLPLGSFGTVDHNLHRKRRQANSPFFSTKSVAASETTLKTQLEILSAKFSDRLKNNEVVVMRNTVLAYTTDALGSICFDEAFGFQKNEKDAEEWASTMEAVAALTPLLKQFPSLIGFADYIPLPVIQMLNPTFGRLLKFQKDMLKRAADFLTATPQEKPEVSKEDRQKLFQIIIDSNLPPEEKTASRIGSEAFTILGAGGDTVARAIATTTFHILSNPHVLRSLKQELKEAIPIKSEILDYRSLKDLVWLTSIIKEGLRIASPVSSRLPLVPPTPLRYKRWTIPAKTPISLSIRDTHYNPEIFTSPSSFMPERWQPDPTTSPLEKYFYPFNKGPRKCPGMDLCLSFSMATVSNKDRRIAYTELYLTLAMLFRRFELELFDTIRERDIDLRRDCFLAEAMPGSQGVRVKVVGEVKN
ncbi:hypothetical protein HYALB_00010291 [Hymenoscyphus albidus]|uniref:Cytochrome P450 n=1 Tax=Hymenoscyphus albidus TaxID=595503 RepID=A0A9N9LTJ0_9HELO|nr:hypothetical protein HYALB_00010291 [Hymenoscyphus albidus]